LLAPLLCAIAAIYRLPHPAPFANLPSTPTASPRLVRTTKKKKRFPPMPIPSRLIKNGTFCRVTCKTKAGDTIPAVIIYDGTFYYFTQSDIEVFLKEYPADSRGWFFNQSKDRYIAEKTPFGISVNPAFVAKHFMERIYEP